MSSDVTKRALSAGLGVGALALLAPRASADTPFSSFAFRATGAPTARTLPDRLGELKTVKDFGAKGDGATDDTAAIQAAFDSTRYGTIYFPGGTYRVTASIKPKFDFFGYDVIGSASILAHFDDYVFRFVGVSQGSGVKIRGLYIENGSWSPNAGALLLHENFATAIRDCSFLAARCITFRQCASCMVENCVFRGVNPVSAPPPGSKGIFMGSYSPEATGGSVNMSVLGCDFNGFEHGIQWQGGASVRNCRIEGCTYGVTVGMTEAGGTYASGGQLEHLEMEACGTFVWLAAANYGATLRMIAMQVDEGFSSAPDGGESFVGLRVGEWARVLVEMLGCEGNLRDAAIKFEGPGHPIRSTFIGVIGTANPGPTRPGAMSWKGMEVLDRSQVTFIQCNNP
jgi:hypothetical protein